MAPGAQPLTHGVVYVKDDWIVDVRDASAPAAQPPPGFEAVSPDRPKGTIYPGLIELHNHLSYNALPLWDVPKQYTNRDQWSRATRTASSISGPMQIVGDTPGCRR